MRIIELTQISYQAKPYYSTKYVLYFVRFDSASIKPETFVVALNRF
jgi:hypothetical protein